MTTLPPLLGGHIIWHKVADARSHASQRLQCCCFELRAADTSGCYAVIRIHDE